jgi:hypothetical protein
VEHLPGSSEDESDSWDEDGGDEEFGGKKKNRPERLEVGNFSFNTALLLLTKDISFPQKVFVPAIRSEHEESNWTWDRMLSFCNDKECRTIVAACQKATHVNSCSNRQLRKEIKSVKTEIKELKEFNNKLFGMMNVSLSNCT